MAHLIWRTFQKVLKMRHNLELVARPEGVLEAVMDNGLVWRTCPETDKDSPGGSPLLANQAEPLGYVYFIRAGRTNLVKIGWATDVDKRQRELQTASPHPLHLIGYEPGSLFDEADWHDRFKHLRVRGEWFLLAADLRDTINKLPYTNCSFVQFLPLSLLTRNAT